MNEESLNKMFPNSGGMSAAKERNEAIAEQEQTRRDQYHREMDNIKKHGPLTRTEEKVLTPEEQGALEEENETGRKPLDSEEEGLRALAENEEWDALADRIQEDFEAMGATEADLAMVGYYANLVRNTDDPAWKRWAAEMAVWTKKTLKARGGV
jgi:hypothetical protein